jgi:hypothetical protein
MSAEQDYYNYMAEGLNQDPDGTRLSFDTQATVRVEKQEGKWVVVGIDDSDFNLGTVIEPRQLARRYPVPDEEPDSQCESEV